MILISIIIPVYNVEKYLNSCLDSVLAQIYENWECLLIDDGSKDSSGKICDEYASKDSRFRVFHKENGGVSSARNLGLDNAEGEWVTFVDSDDVLTNNFFSDFIIALQENQDIDLFVGDVLQQRMDGSTFVEFEFTNGIYSLRDAITINRLLRSGDLHAKFFLLDVIKECKITFNEKIFYAEDGLFFDTYLYASNKLYFTSNICYKYKRNQTGLSYRLNSFDSESFCYKELKSILLKIQNKTKIDIKQLLHNSPICRTLNSGVHDLSKVEFSEFLCDLDDLDVYFFNRGLLSFRCGNLLSKFFLRKNYGLLYTSLTFLQFIKKTKARLKNK